MTRVEKTIRLMIHLSPTTREQVGRLAKLRDTTCSETIRQLIREEARRLGLLRDSGEPGETGEEGENG